jgi:steroid 5-alpha reductase family enzyme
MADKESTTDYGSASDSEQLTDRDKKEDDFKLNPPVVIIVFLGLSYAVATALRAWIACSIAFGVQYIVFLLVAWPQRSEKFYDFTGMCTFILVVIYSYIIDAGVVRDHFSRVRSIVLSLMVLCWTLRLGTFLFARIRGDGGEDRRFDPIRNHFGRFLMSWTLQGVWVFFCTLPLIYVNSRNKSENGITPLDIVGWALWVLGFGCEAIADRQKTEFKEKPENRGKFINVGLWAFSRHPNYFGEIVLWLGVSLSALSVAEDWGYLVLLSPLWTATLLIGISGIPLTEKRADDTYGNDPAYLQYKASTPVLVPFCMCWK